MRGNVIFATFVQFLTCSRSSISIGVILESCGSLADMIIFSSVMLNSVSVHAVFDRVEKSECVKLTKKIIGHYLSLE